MKCIVFSDIHGNLEALQAMLKREQNQHSEEKKPEQNKQYTQNEQLKQHEQRKRSEIFIFCGDVCGYYYHAYDCVELLKSIDNLVAVRGNHDQYYLNSFHDISATKHLVKQYGSSYLDKMESVRAFIDELPLQRTLEIGNQRIFVQHGSPGSPNDLLECRLYPDTNLPETLSDGIYLVGHTHYRMLRKCQHSLWLNPGSLGQPRDGKGFSYCTFDIDSMTFSFQSVKIDIANLIAEIRTRDTANKYLEEILYRRS